MCAALLERAILQAQMVGDLVGAAHMRAGTGRLSFAFCQVLLDGFVARRIRSGLNRFGITHKDGITHKEDEYCLCTTIFPFTLCAKTCVN